MGVEAEGYDLQIACDIDVNHEYDLTKSFNYFGDCKRAAYQDARLNGWRFTGDLVICKHCWKLGNRRNNIVETTNL